NDEGKVEITRKGEKEPITIAVHPGKHRLSVQKNGFTIFGQDVAIEAGGWQPITARLVPLTEKPAITEPAPVAENKKRLGFETPGFEQWVKEVAALSAEKQVEAVAKT